MIYQTCGLLHVIIELQTLCNIDWPWKKIADVWTFIRSCGLCIISNGLAETTNLLHLLHYRPSLQKICQTFIGLGEIYQMCQLYKVWASLYNIDLPYRNHRTWAVYKVWHSLYNIKRPCKNHRTSAPYTLSTVLTENLPNIYQPWRKLPDMSTLQGLGVFV